MMARRQLQRVCYRSRQFFRAIMAARRPLTTDELALARRHLPATAWSLFDAMPRADQRHGLRVLAALQAIGETEPALLQAALLHDCAKRVGVRLWQRVARVLLKAFWPTYLARLAVAPEPDRESWLHGLWLLLHHDIIGAEMAAAAGCDPLVATLIRHHEAPLAVNDAVVGRLLAVLQTADDDS